MYELNSVSKHYGETSVLTNLSCSIPLDGLVVVMGPSGSGKSTLLRLLSFLEVPDTGDVRLNIDDKTFRSRDPQRPWPLITCVFQKQFLWPHLTLRENIALPLRASRMPECEQHVNSVIDLFAMSSFVERYPNEVSGGQAQRAALARALVLRPRLILIDEAHVGLDLEQQQVLNEYLLKLRDTGVSIIVVTHSLDFARAYADRIVVIENGNVAENGGKELLQSPTSRYLSRALGIGHRP
jgi:sulfate transport system ATP-binding protein